MNPLEQIVKEHFGVTRDLRETGYILSDGTLVDLSGRHYAGGYMRRGDRFAPKRGEPDYLAAQRSTDHRELPEKLTEILGKSGGEAMFAFLEKTGALRMMPGVGFSVVSMPAVEAVDALVKEWRRSYTGDSIVVDILNKEGWTEDSLEIKEPTVDKVVGFLEGHFNKPVMGRSEGGKMAKDIVTIEELAKTYGLPSWDDVEEANVDHISEAGSLAYDEAVKDGMSEKKAEGSRETAELETANEVYSTWSNAVEQAASSLLGDHSMRLEEVKLRGHPTGEFRILPDHGKSWSDAARALVMTIRGVGFTDVAPGEWSRAPKEFVLTRWRASRSAPEVYGRSTAMSVYGSFFG